MSDTPMALRPALCLDLGGTQLRTAFVRADGRLGMRRTRRTPRAADEMLAVAADALNETRRYAEKEGEDQPVAIGISAPGPLDTRTGTLIDPPNLDESMWNFALSAEIADRVGLPATVDKDTNVAALGEGYFGAAAGVADFVYLTISTGVGGAIVTSGRILHGPDGVAGELGHLAIDAYDGPLCGCGARGHLEAISSGTGIAKAAAAAGLAVGTASAADVARLEAAGNEVAARIMDRARQGFAAAAITIVDLFNPDLVIVGGGIAAAEGERLLGPARDAVQRTAFRVQARRARIVPPVLGDDVSLVGGLILANAALLAVQTDDAALGLRPTVQHPGQRALSIEPVYPDHTNGESRIDPETNRAVATR